jgi:hypothetical protein
MSFLPARLDDDAPSGLTSRQLVKASQVQANTELEIHRHFLRARALAEMDQIDSQATADALRAGLDEELSLLRDGLAQAGQSVAAVEIVARKVELLSGTNNRRFVRRFGS